MMACNLLDVALGVYLKHLWASHLHYKFNLLHTKKTKTKQKQKTNDGMYPIHDIKSKSMCN